MLNLKWFIFVFLFLVTNNEDEKTSSENQSWKVWSRKHIFKQKVMHRRFPITAWLPNYDQKDFIGDLVAGITVGLTVIPQALAYAGIAGLDVKVWMALLFLLQVIVKYK